jgi:uncharacterized membrane protein YqjE
MDEPETVHPGLLATFRRLAATLVAIIQNRLELLLVELQEERVHLIKAVLLTAAIVALGAFTLAMAACALSIVVWNQFGVQGLWALSGLGLLGTLLTYWQLRTRLKNWPLLPGTLAELKKDRDCLGGSK